MVEYWLVSPEGAGSNPASTAIFKLSSYEKRSCPACRSNIFEKGRAFDGRRAYLCNTCSRIWTEGMQGREKENTQFKEKVTNLKNKRM